MLISALDWLAQRTKSNWRGSDGTTMIDLGNEDTGSFPCCRWFNVDYEYELEGQMSDSSIYLAWRWAQLLYTEFDYRVTKDIYVACVL